VFLQYNSEKFEFKLLNFVAKLAGLRHHHHHHHQQGVCHSHCGLAIYITKYLKAKEELWKLKYFTPCKKYNLQKILLKKTKILQDIIITLITNLKFQHNPKYHLSKILI